MKMKQTELSDHLMDVFLDLKNMSLEHERHKEAMEHAKTLAIVAEKLIANGALVLSACRTSENAARSVKLPLMFTE
jgi:hypothetical protein